MVTKAERQADLIRIRAQLSTAFNPSGPVSSLDLFAGRLEQISQLLSAVGQIGQHVVLFGERGVGKTSLASLTHELWNQVMKGSTTVFPVRLSCSQTDTFGSVWANIAELITDEHEKRHATLPSGETWNELLAEIKMEDANPHSIRRFLSLLGKKFIIVIDEFDQLGHEGSIGEFATTIKGLSDYLVETTLILVGVADTVDNLIEDYASVERALIQVRMPRMSTDELVDIISKGYNRVGLEATSESLETMGRLAQGLPHYAHRFGQEAGYAAVDHGKTTVDRPEVAEAVNKAIELTNETIRAAYRQATTGPHQKDAIFDKVLLACALTMTDELGYFPAADVRDPLFRTTKRHYQIPQFVGHLRKFCTKDRGAVLQTEGEPWSRRYRFLNPLLRPYVVLKGIQDNVISQETVERFNHPGRRIRGTQGSLPI